MAFVDGTTRSEDEQKSSKNNIYLVALASKHRIIYFLNFIQFK